MGISNVLHKSTPEEELRKVERSEEELERLVAMYMSGDLDHDDFIKKVKELKIKFNLRRAGSTLKSP